MLIANSDSCKFAQQQQLYQLITATVYKNKNLNINIAQTLSQNRRTQGSNMYGEFKCMLNQASMLRL